MRRMIGWFGLTLCWSVGAAEPEAPAGEALTGPRLVHWTEISPARVHHVRRDRAGC